MRQAGEHRVLPECIDQTSFYLDQLFGYLSNTIAQKDNENSPNFNINSQTSEEKIKEMWEKMIYTLCRCPFDWFMKQSCHIFTILTSF